MLNYMEREIPMETPTEIELRPGYSIRVTLFDANHCPGSCMFLIQGQGRAILYSGDVRAEKWWINTISRHPVLIPYTLGMKTLDKIYLDTTHADTEKGHYDFGTKADGIRDLLSEIEKYPSDTVFHFNTWTFGYEEVWVALASYFQTKIHVDTYKYRLYKSCADKTNFWDGPYLNGFSVGNTDQDGVLTEDPNVRFHSCERGIGCPGLASTARVVHLSPIVKKTQDSKTGLTFIEREIGESSGGDLSSIHYLECDQLLLSYLSKSDKAKELFMTMFNKDQGSVIPIDLDPEDDRDLELDEIARILQRKYDKDVEEEFMKSKSDHSVTQISTQAGSQLRSWFGFAYARHSSYSELRDLVQLFRPKDVYPCVVPDAIHHLRKSIKTLFGDVCSGSEHCYDNEVEANITKLRQDQLQLSAEMLQKRRDAGIDLPSSHGMTSYEDAETQHEQSQDRSLALEQDMKAHQEARRSLRESLRESMSTVVDVHDCQNGVQKEVSIHTISEAKIGPLEKAVEQTNSKVVKQDVRSDNSVIPAKRAAQEQNVDESEDDDGGYETDEDAIRYARDAVLGLNGMDWHTLSNRLGFNSTWKYQPEIEL